MNIDMNYKWNLWSISTLLVLVLCGCGKQTNLKQALEEAGDNRLELLRVIDHYRNVDNADSLKLKAALFLIENMRGHGTMWSEAVDTFRSRVAQSDTPVAMKQMNLWWDELAKNHRPVLRQDLNHVKASFLIQNIDGAFKAWREAPWREEIDFDLFCHYVLPYRFETELLAYGWRDSLYREYHPLVKEARTMKEAFEILYGTVSRRLRSNSSHFPHILDVVAMRHQQRAMCVQRCVMVGAVMRSVGIPVAVDNVGRWANYSRNGHAWAALITNEGTYSVYENEKVAKINNRIDATEFELKHPIPEDFPMRTDFKKRYAKIWRSTFERQPLGEASDDEWGKQLTSPFRMDVSAAYGLDNWVEIHTDRAVKRAYLCTFATGADWSPIAAAKVKNGQCRFEALGDSVVYAVIGFEEGNPVALEDAFLLLDGKKHTLSPDKENAGRAVLTRKYPLTGKWPNEWVTMPGARFEGSDDKEFARTEVLARVERMPIFRNVLKPEGERKFRYIRYCSAKTCDTPMAEVELWSGGRKVKAVPGKSTVKHVELSLDGNTLTRPDINSGYTLGYELEKPVALDSIVFYPWNDDNFILPTHEYELFYYDKRWMSLGKRKPEAYALVYDEVPVHALLLLKDRTTGKEERPFTYENGEQVWW